VAAKSGFKQVVHMMLIVKTLLGKKAHDPQLGPGVKLFDIAPPQVCECR
jgi:hypothetical protein